MNDIAAHSKHFEAHVKRLYNNFSKFIVLPRMFDDLPIDTQTFTFAGYKTLYAYAQNGILFMSRPIEVDQRSTSLPAPSANEWVKVDKRIKKFVLTGKI